MYVKFDLEMSVLAQLRMPKLMFFVYALICAWHGGDQTGNGHGNVNWSNTFMMFLATTQRHFRNAVELKLHEEFSRMKGKPVECKRLIPCKLVLENNYAFLVPCIVVMFVDVCAVS